MNTKAEALLLVITGAVLVAVAASKRDRLVLALAVASVVLAALVYVKLA